MKKHKTYKTTTFAVTIVAIFLFILYVVLFIFNFRMHKSIFEIKEVFISASSGLLVGVILFYITNMRDNELRGLDAKIEYLHKIIDMYNDFCKLVLLSNKKRIMKNDLNKYCISIQGIKDRYKSIRLNKIFKNFDKELYKYITENIGKDLFKKAKKFSKVEQLEKYVNKNRFKIENIRTYLNYLLSDYLIEYNKIVN